MIINYDTKLLIILLGNTITVTGNGKFSQLIGKTNGISVQEKKIFNLKL